MVIPLIVLSFPTCTAILSSSKGHSWCSKVISSCTECDQITDSMVVEVKRKLCLQTSSIKVLRKMWVYAQFFWLKMSAFVIEGEEISHLLLSACRGVLHHVRKMCQSHIWKGARLQIDSFLGEIWHTFELIGEI